VSQRLHLTSQTQAIQDSTGSIQTKVLAVTGLDLEADSSPMRNSDTPRDDVSAGSVDWWSSADGLFGSAMVYRIDNDSPVLLQELAAAESVTGTTTLDGRWNPGSVSLRRSFEGATGRYALYDVASASQLGEIVSVPSSAAAQRVVCFTPSGLILVATARDTLVVLDARDAGRRGLVAEGAFDLYWTACAWSGG
jgi:hypothetical protein